MFAAVSLATQFSATGGGRRERGLYEYERRRDPNSDSPQPALGSATKIRFGPDLKAKSGPLEWTFATLLSLE